MAAETEKGGAPGEGAADPGEAEAWAEVERAWKDEERHRAYLARFGDLEGLAVAGARYRGALAARPGDAAALRFRDEILRRATALGLGSAPRAGPERTRSPRIARGAALAFALVLAAAAALAAFRLFSALGGRP